MGMMPAASSVQVELLLNPPILVGGGGEEPCSMMVSRRGGVLARLVAAVRWIGCFYTNLYNVGHSSKSKPICSTIFNRAN